MQIQLDRANRKEITDPTIRNYLKSIKLFCEMADLKIAWREISRGLPGAKNNRMIESQQLKKQDSYWNTQTED